MDPLRKLHPEVAKVLEKSGRKDLTKVVNGVLKDPEDERDFRFAAKVPVFKLPKKVDLREYAREIENQLSTGSCVAQATSSALELMGEEQGKRVNLSRLFIYWEARAPYPELRGKDNGAYLRDGFKACNKVGVCEEKYWPFDESLVNIKPQKIAYEQAKHKVLRYERVNPKVTEEMKASLASGFPVVIGMMLYYDFYYISGSLEEQNYRGSLDPNNRFIGGHAMNVVGYDDDLNGGSFIVENSWSDKWGDEGYCAIPYDVMAADCMDAWTCTDFKIYEESKEDTNSDEENEQEIDLNVKVESQSYLLEKIFKYYYARIASDCEGLIQTRKLNKIREAMLEILEEI